MDIVARDVEIRWNWWEINKESTYWKYNWRNVIYSLLIEWSDLVDHVFTSQYHWWVFWLMIIFDWRYRLWWFDLSFFSISKYFVTWKCLQSGPNDCILKTMLSKEMVYKMFEKKWQFSLSSHHNLLQSVN